LLSEADGELVDLPAEWEEEMEPTIGLEPMTCALRKGK
jgi:hypothetical protein